LSGFFTAIQKDGQILLQKDDIYHLTKHQPSIELRWDSLPLVPFIHLHFQFPFPPFSPLLALWTTIGRFDIQPSSLLEGFNNPFPFTLLSEYPGESKIITSSPERKVEQEKD
jgi:hypothetical protein